MLKWLKSLALERKEQTLFEYIDEDKTVRTVSYAQFHEDVIRLADMIQTGYGVGKHIGLLENPGYIWWLYFFAIQCSGNVAVIYNYSLAVEDIVALIRLSDTTNVILGKEYEGYCGTIEKECACQSSFVYPLSVIRSRVVDESKLQTEDLDAGALILFSSGTSGGSKAVLLSMRNWLAPLIELSGEPVDGKRVLILFPVYHVGACCILGYAMKSGYRICIARQSKYLFSDIEIYLPDYIHGVPSMAEAIVKKKKRGMLFVDSLSKKPECFISAGTALPSETVKLLKDHNIDMASQYGMTECGNVTDIASGTSEYVGRVSRHNQVRIIDNEICVSGANVMLGYYNNTTETKEVMDEQGWLHTGDLGYIDADGFLYLTGRKKNIIILSNGENVSPEEIEDRLLQKKEIEEIVVYEQESVIAAQVYYICQDDAEKMGIEKRIEEYVQEYNKSVPLYKQIRKLGFRETPFEKTGSGKIKRYLL